MPTIIISGDQRSVSAALELTAPAEQVFEALASHFVTRWWVNGASWQSSFAALVELLRR